MEHGTFHKDRQEKFPWTARRFAFLGFFAVKHPCPSGCIRGLKISIASRACFRGRFRDDGCMSGRYKPSGPVSLSESQIVALHEKLRAMRHDVNGRLANIVAAAELMRLRPETAEERLKMLLEQPHRAAESIAEFSREFEAALGLKTD